MRNRFAAVVIGVLAGAFVLVGVQTKSSRSAAAGTGKATQAAQDAAAASTGKPTRAECLGCHGPFEKLTSVTDKYTAPSGEKISPHRFVPHASTRDEDVPECANCHTAHALEPLPTRESVDLSKTNVNWCYETCHHEKNFTSCKECHP